MKNLSLSFCFLAISLARVDVRAFLPVANPSPGPTTSSLCMGLFDGIMKAFDNEEFSSPPEGIKATARHILVDSPADAQMVMDQISDGGNFADLAKQFSSCPSSVQGGSLGSFSPGTMVPEFDKLIFDPETNLGEVVGPVKTDFGYHLIVVDNRTGV